MYCTYLRVLLLYLCVTLNFVINPMPWHDCDNFVLALGSTTHLRVVTL